jgi:hypothetical protein
MTDMKSGKKQSYDPGSNDISSAIDHGQDGLNPNKSLPVQLTFGVSIGVFVLLLLATVLYYNGAFT